MNRYERFIKDNPDKVSKQNLAPSFKIGYSYRVGDLPPGTVVTFGGWSERYIITDEDGRNFGYPDRVIMRKPGTSPPYGHVPGRDWWQSSREATAEVVG